MGSHRTYGFGDKPPDPTPRKSHRYTAPEVVKMTPGDLGLRLVLRITGEFPVGDAPYSFWLGKPNPIDGTRLWDNS